MNNAQRTASGAPSEKAWTGTTIGTSRMHRWLIAVLRHTDVRIWYVFAAVFVVPPCVIFRAGGRHAYRFFRARMGCGRLQAVWKTYVNHCRFSEVIIDRFAMYAGKHFTTDVEGYDHYKRLAAREEGFVQLSAHVGNYELAGYTLTADTKPFNALVFAGEKASVMTNRDRLFHHTNIHMIAVKSDMSHIFEIDRVLQNGETVSMPADRMLGSKKSVRLPFLGKVAAFPQGPFSVAAMRGLDVLAVNVMKISWRHYTIYVTPLSYDKTAARREQLSQLATAYVAELERIVRRYPTQWYNYYDFWV